MYNKEALRKLLEDCWDASDLFQMNEFTKNKFPDKETYITTRLAALDDGQEGKGQAIIEKIKYHAAKLEESDLKTDIRDDRKRITEINFLINNLAALPVADGEGEKVGESVPDLSNATDQEKDEVVRNVMYECGKQLLMTHVALGLKEFMEVMIVNDSDKKEYILSFRAADSHLKRFPLPSAVTGGVKWVKGDVFVTTFWGEPEVCIIHSFTETEVNFIRLESIKDIKDIKDNYCSAGLIKKIFDGMNKTFIHHSTWYSEYRDESPSPTPAPQEGKDEK